MCTRLAATASASPRATATTSAKVTGPTPTTTLESFMAAAFVRWETARDDAVDDRHSGSVGEVDVGGCVERDEVRAHPDGEDTYVVAPQRGSPAGGGRPQRLRRRQMHVADGECDAERDAGRVGRAGIAVRRERDGHACLDEPSTVRPRCAGGEFGAGQQGGHGVARRERLEIAVVGERTV